MTSPGEKGGGTFAGIEPPPGENSLPPVGKAVAAAQSEAARSNDHPEPCSAALRELPARA